MNRPRVLAVSRRRAVSTLALAPAWIAGCLLANFAAGQNLVPNPSFESGATNPAPWAVVGPGGWENFGHTGNRSVSVAGEPYSTRTWSAPVPAEVGRSYWVRFWCSVSNSLRGFCYGGINTARRDFSGPSQRWTEYAYAAWVPDAGAPQMELASWDGGGPVYFDDAEVLPLNAVYKRAGNYDLGAGESLSGGRYTFSTQYGSFGGNASRAIHQANTVFNTSRWYMNPGSYVIYRHELAGQTFSNAAVTCQILNYNNINNTTLIVEASDDGQNWLPAGALAQTTGGTFLLPVTLPPAAALWVRLRSTNAIQFALTQYTFAADVPDAATSAVGDTFFLGQMGPSLGVAVVDIQGTVTGRVATIAITNSSLASKTYECTASTTAASVVRERQLLTALPAASGSLVALALPTAGFGENSVVITVRDLAADAVVFQQIHRFTVNILNDDSFGELLPSPSDCPAWAGSGSYKVGRTRGLPVLTNTAVHLSAARNEYEPFQLVLRPPATLSNVWVTVGDFVSITNPALVFSGTNVTIERVEYVNITIPDLANFASVLGEHPDPLPPLTAPFVAPGGTNSPLWLTVYVPKDTPGGIYTNLLSVSYDGGSFTVPVQLRVFDFALTDVTHTRTQYGVAPQLGWHGLGWETTPDHLAVWELYLQNMARHRFSPVVPNYYARIIYNYDVGTDSFAYNFDAFDEVMERYLEEYQFNSFRDVTIYAALPYLPGVDAYNAQYTAIMPEYRRRYLKFMPPIMQHFRERGWMGLGLADWIDEPAAAQLPMVRQGMEMIQEAGPDHPRMLAGFNSPEPQLFGVVSVWVPHWGHDTQYQHLQPRREAGDEIWYYPCVTPKDPWPNNFIDQPGISPRIRQWYAELLQFQGEFYWGINSYLGVTNPWTQTMSRGGSLNLGHGDGTLVYPPVKEPPTNGVVVAGPVNSVRYETSRDGYEDREYFWLLKRLLAVRESLLGTNHPFVVEARNALAEALSIPTWPPIYPYEPHRLEAARLRLAEAIEALDDGRPFIAKEPLSKVVVAGGSERLRVEAVGWPIPAIQWQHAGTNLPGGLGAKLSLANITPAMVGEYRVIATNSSGSVTSAVGRLTVLVTNQPPVVIKHPDSLVRTNVDRAVFGVGASSLTPIAYQWLLNNVPLPGATNVTLVVPGVNLSLAGLYSVVAANAHGSVTSSPALLDVHAPPGTSAPVLATQPASQTVAVGQNLQFSVAATNATPLNYQWSFNGTNLSAGGVSNVLALTNVQTAQAGSYQVVVWNVAGAATSAVAALTVQVLPPSITAHPANQTVAQGQNAQFTAAAAGTAPLAFRWLFNGTNLIAGAGGNTLGLTNVQPAQVGSYSLQVTNAVGSVTSAPALLQLAGMPNYTTEPPGVNGQRQGNTFVLALAPDNRSRTVLVSSNLLDWEEFYSAAPTAAQESLFLATSNSPYRFFRVRVTP